MAANRSWQQHAAPSSHTKVRLVLIFAAIFLASCATRTDAAFQFGRDHHFAYDSIVMTSGEVGGPISGVGSGYPLRVKAELVVRPIEEDIGFQLCRVEFTRVFFFREKAKDAFVMVPSDYDFSQYFAFRQLDSGEIVEVNYPKSDRLGTINLKKGMLSSLSSRIHDDMLRSRRGVETEWHWQANETSHGGEHKSEYSARLVNTFFHVSKKSNTSDEHGLRSEKKVIIVDAESMVFRHVSIEESMFAHAKKTPAEFASEGLQGAFGKAVPAEQRARRADDKHPEAPKIDHEMPSWKFNGRASTNMTLVRTAESPDVVHEKPHDMESDTLLVRVQEVRVDPRWLSQATQHLECFNQNPTTGTAARATCFSSLLNVLSTISDRNMTMFARRFLVDQADPVHALVVIDALASIGSVAAQEAIVRFVLLHPDRPLGEVHQAILAIHHVTNPSPLLVDTIEKMCFAASDLVGVKYDLSYFSETRRMVMLAFGSIVLNLKKSDPQAAEELIALVHAELDDHHTGMRRRGIGLQDETGSVHDYVRHLSILVDTLGNAGMPSSLDRLFVHVDSEQTFLRASALHSLRHYPTEAAIEDVLLRGMNDTDRSVRACAGNSFVLQPRYSDHPPPPTNPDDLFEGLPDEHPASRARRLTLGQIFDWSWSIELRAPGFFWQTGFGNDQIGAFAKAEERNGVTIYLSILKSFLDFDIYNEAAAYINAFGKRIYVFQVLFAYVCKWGYDFEIIRKFNIDDIASIGDVFNKIKGWIEAKIREVYDLIKLAIEKFKDVAISVIDAIKAIPDAIVGLFNKIVNIITGKGTTTDQSKRDEEALIKTLVDLTKQFIEDLLGMSLDFIWKSVERDISLLGITGDNGVKKIIFGITNIAECPLYAVLAIIEGADDIRQAIFSTNVTLGWGLIPLGKKMIVELGLLDGGIPPWLTQIPPEAYVMKDEFLKYLKKCAEAAKNASIVSDCSFQKPMASMFDAVEKIESTKQWVMNVTSFYMEQYENVTAKYTLLKSKFEEVRKFFDNIFGTKFHSDFPRDPWSGDDCGKGVFIADAKEPGIDLKVATDAKSIVFPFKGTLSERRGSGITFVGEGALKGFDIIMNDFTPGGDLTVGMRVVAGAVAGKPKLRSCSSDPILHIKIKRSEPEEGEPNYIDPSKYLKRRVNIGLTKDEKANRIKFIFALQTKLDRPVLATDGAWKKGQDGASNSAEKPPGGASAPPKPTRRDVSPVTSLVDDASAPLHRDRRALTCDDFTPTKDVCMSFEKRNLLVLSIPIKGFEFSYSLGPVTLTAKFGAFLDFGLDLTMTLCLMSKSLTATVTPHVGVSITASATIDIGIASAGVTITGVLMEIGLPIHAIVKFTGFPLDICIQLDLYIIPIKFTFYGRLSVCFLVCGTIFDEPIFEWSATPIRFDKFFDNCKPKPDKTPPEWIKLPTAWQEFWDPIDDPFLLGEWEADDKDTGIDKVEWGGGSTPGATDIFAFERIEGNRMRSRIPNIPEGTLYVTFRATNKQGLTSSKTVDPISWDLTVPDIEVYDGNATNYYLTSTFTDRPQQRFRNETSATYFVKDKQRPLILLQWAVGTTPVAKVPPVDDMSNIVAWQNLTYYADGFQGIGSGRLYAPPFRHQRLFQHNTIYYTFVRAMNELGFENIVGSKGFLVDLTPPDRAEVYGGLRRGSHVMYTQINTVVGLNWDVFIDRETNIINYYRALGTCPCDADIPSNCTSGTFMDDKLPWERFEPTTTDRVDNISPPLADGSYFWRVKATNWVDLVSVPQCRRFVIDTSPPYFVAIGARTCEFNLCVYMDYDPLTDILSAQWKAVDPESDIQYYEYALGTDPTDISIMAWTNVGLNTTYLISAPPSGKRLVAKVRAYNNVLLTARAYSNEIFLDSTPPIPGRVFDGPILQVDLAYSNDDQRLFFNWDNFNDPDSGMRGYYAIMANASGPFSRDDEVDLYPENVSKDLLFPMQTNSVYRTMIVGKHGGAFELTSNATSDGILIDMTESAFERPTALFDGSVVGIDQRFQYISSALTANWLPITDPQSLIARLDVAYVQGSFDGPQGEYAKIPEDEFEGVRVLNETTISAISHLNLIHSNRYFFVVRAEDGAGWVTFFHTDGIIVDLTAPTYVYMRDANLLVDLDFQSHADNLTMYMHVEDPESGFAYLDYQLWMASPGVSMINGPNSMKAAADPLRPDAYEFEKQSIGYTRFECTPFTQRLNSHKCAIVVLPIAPFVINPSATYFFVSRAINQATLETSFQTNGIAVDTTPPEMLYAYMGLQLPERSRQYDNKTIYGNWLGVDAQSDVKSYKGLLVTIGANADDKYNPKVPGGLFDSGHWYGVCDGGVESGSEPLSKALTLAMKPGSTCTNRKKQRVTAVGNWTDFKIGRYGRLDLSPDQQLIVGYQYFIVVYATNGALLDSFPLWSSQGVLVVPAPAPGLVLDGPAGADIEFTRGYTVVTASFFGFTSFAYGFTAFEVAVGTGNGTNYMTNILEFDDDLVVVTSKDLTSGGGFVHIALPLEPSLRYNVTIRGRTQEVGDDGSYITVFATSNGFVPDIQPPLLTNLRTGIDRPAHTTYPLDGYQVSGDVFPAKWSATDAYPCAKVAPFKCESSGLNTISYAVGTYPYGGDIISKTQSTRFSDLQLEIGKLIDPRNSSRVLFSNNGTSYGLPIIFSLWATDRIGLETSIASMGVTVDQTSPSLGAVDCGGEFQSDQKSFTCVWRGFNDPESGIVLYTFSVGTFPGDTSVVTNVTTLDKAHRSRGLNLLHGRTYYGTVSALNRLGMESIASSSGVFIDTTPPVGSIVIEVSDFYVESRHGLAFYAKNITDYDDDCQTSPDTILVRWLPFTDIEKTPVTRYDVAVGTTRGGIEILPFVNTGTFDSLASYYEYTIRDLILSPSTKYYVTVRGYNAVNLFGTASSNGIYVAFSPNPFPKCTYVRNYIPDLINKATGEVLDATETKANKALGIAWEFHDGCNDDTLTYEVRITTNNGDAEIYPWTALLGARGAVGSVYLEELNLTNTFSYKVSVRATNVLGFTATKSGNAIKVVNGGPPSPGKVFDGSQPGVDIDFQASLSVISATWSDFVDFDGGVVDSYEWAIGTDPRFDKLMKDVLDWTPVQNATAATSGVLAELTPLEVTYYVSVRATGKYGLSVIATSNGIKVGFAETELKLDLGIAIGDYPGSQLAFQQGIANFISKQYGLTDFGINNIKVIDVSAVKLFDVEGGRFVVGGAPKKNVTEAPVDASVPLARRMVYGGDIAGEIARDVSARDDRVSWQGERHSNLVVRTVYRRDTNGTNNATFANETLSLDNRPDDFVPVIAPAAPSVRVSFVIDYPRIADKLKMTDDQFAENVAGKLEVQSTKKCKDDGSPLVGPAAAAATAKSCLDVTIGVPVNEVTLDLNEPEGGTVWDGIEEGGVDVDFQTNTDSLTVSWTEFKHSEGTIRYEVAVGLDPSPVVFQNNSRLWSLKNDGAFEILNFTVALPECPKEIRAGAEPCFPASTVTLTGLGLKHNVTYYATVKAVSRIGTIKCTTTTGVLVDTTNPTAGTLEFQTTAPPLIAPNAFDVIMDIPPLSARVRYQADVTQVVLSAKGFSDYESGVAAYYSAVLSYPKSMCTQVPVMGAPPSGATVVDELTGLAPYPFYIEAGGGPWAKHISSFNVSSPSVYYVPFANNDTASNFLMANVTQRYNSSNTLQIDGLTMTTDNIYYVAVHARNGARLGSFAHTRGMMVDSTAANRGSIVDGVDLTNDLAYQFDNTTLRGAFYEVSLQTQTVCDRLVENFTLSAGRANWKADNFTFDRTAQNARAVVLSPLRVSHSAANGTTITIADGSGISAMSGGSFTRVGVAGRKMNNGRYRWRMQAALGTGAVTTVAFFEGDRATFPMNTPNECSRACYASPYVRGFAIQFYGDDLVTESSSGATVAVRGNVWFTTGTDQITFRSLALRFDNGTEYDPYASSLQYEVVIRNNDVSLFIENSFVVSFSLAYRMASVSITVAGWANWQPQNSPPIAARFSGFELPNGDGRLCEHADAFLDTESPIVRYYYAVGTSPNGVDILPYTNVTDPNVCMPCRGDPCDTTYCDPKCDATKPRVISVQATGLKLADYAIYCNVNNGGCDKNANCTTTTRPEDHFRTCTCRAGFNGTGYGKDSCVPQKFCAANLKLCDPDSSTCVELPNIGSFVCQCNSGFAKDTAGNCINENECSAQNQQLDTFRCSPYANCIDSPGSYACVCKKGFAGDGKKCANVDECTTTPNICGLNTDCTDVFGSYTCSCKPGYFNQSGVCIRGGDTCAGSLQMKVPDVGESSRITGIIDPTSTPVVVPACGPRRTGSFGTWNKFIGTGSPVSLTTCVPGADLFAIDTVIEVFRSDANDCTGLSCVAVSDDAEDCGLLSRTAPFTAELGVVYHVVVRGVSASVSGRYALDLYNYGIIDAVCGCTNGGTCDLQTKKCACLPGHSGTFCEQKIDRSWCDEGNGALCDPHAECVNFDNTGLNGTCQCVAGFEGDGFTCANIDECETQQFPAGQACDFIAQCEDTYGSYNCRCPEGYLPSGGRGPNSCQTDQSQYANKDKDTVQETRFPITYYVSVQAVNAAGLITLGVTNGLAVDTTAPSFTSIEHLDILAPDDKADLDTSFQASADTLIVRWKVEDRDSGVVKMRIALGTDAAPMSLSGGGYLDLPATITKYTYVSPSPLVQGAIYKAILVAQNGAGLTTTLPSHGVKIDATPPSLAAAWVVDIAEVDLICQQQAPLGTFPIFKQTDDVDWSIVSRRMTVAFGGFADPDSTIETFDWAIGTTSTAEDVLPWVEIGPPAASASPLKGSYATVTPLPPGSETPCENNGAGDLRTICKGGFQYWTKNDTMFLPNFLLERPRTYYNRVRAWNSVRLYVVKASNGVKVVDECSAGSSKCVSATTKPFSSCPFAVPDKAKPVIVTPPPLNYNYVSSGFTTGIGAEEVVLAPLRAADFAATYSGATATVGVSAVDNLPPYQTFLGPSIMPRVFSGIDEVTNPGPLASPATLTINWQADTTNMVNTTNERVDLVVWNEAEKRWQDASTTCTGAPTPRVVTSSSITVKVCLIGQLALVKTKIVALTPNMLTCADSGCIGAVKFVSNGDTATCYCDITCMKFGDCCSDYLKFCPRPTL